MDKSERLNFGIRGLKSYSAANFTTHLFLMKYNGHGSTPPVMARPNQTATLETLIRLTSLSAVLEDLAAICKKYAKEARANFDDPNGSRWEWHSSTLTAATTMIDQQTKDHQERVEKAHGSG